MGRSRTWLVVLVALLAAACGGGGDAGDVGTDGFTPVRTGASGFDGGAPQPEAAGTLFVSNVADGTTFFARVTTPGPTGLPADETRRLRLAGARAPTGDACLAETSARHLEGIIRGGRQVAFVLAEGIDDADGDLAVHAWSRGIWINGEVLARGYADLADEADPRLPYATAARDFARDREQGLWNPALCDAPTTGPGEGG